MSKRKELVTETNEQGCELVVSHVQKKHGHVEIYRDGKKRLVHRYVYEESFGEIPEGLVVRHKCDNPNCINLEHLELGTHADNVADRVERQRSAKGSQNGRAKLTDDDVKYIRNDETHNITQLATMFNVDRKAIRNIKQNKTWKHVK